MKPVQPLQHNLPQQLCGNYVWNTGKCTLCTFSQKWSTISIKKKLNLLNRYLLHSISSGQVTPNISMSFWQSLLAWLHKLRQGKDTRPYSIHTGAYRAHRNGRRSGEHCRFTMGWKGCWGGRTESLFMPREFMTDLVKTRSLALAAVWQKN